MVDFPVLRIALVPTASEMAGYPISGGFGPMPKLPELSILKDLGPGRGVFSRP
jgi:hypothetical protein